MPTANESHQRTPARREFERRYEKQFRMLRFRLEEDHAEHFERLRQEDGLSMQELLSTLTLGWTRMSDKARADLTRLIGEEGAASAADAVGVALSSVAGTADETAKDEQ